jgi:hypothetical protein
MDRIYAKQYLLTIYFIYKKINALLRAQFENVYWIIKLKNMCNSKRKDRTFLVAKMFFN